MPSAHGLAMGLARRWSALASGRLNDGDIARDPALRVSAMGLEFPNPVGLAAGLDKDAEAVIAWQAMGFGSVEVGTVTALPQPGNPRPRLFRLPADAALINRMGFNNAGAEAMTVRLTRLRERGVLQIPLGVNIGKSKLTPAAEAAADYRRSFELLGELADYLVVNISSPNTPGCATCRRSTGARHRRRHSAPEPALSRPRPLLIKLAPDLADADAIACARAALDAGCAGLVLTNTTIRFDALRSDTKGMSGGLSGRPVVAAQHRTAALGARGPGPRNPVLIGVGGVMDAATAAGPSSRPARTWSRSTPA
jgi:dihydroorotate dehydrogenase